MVVLGGGAQVPSDLARRASIPATREILWKGKWLQCQAKGSNVCRVLKSVSIPATREIHQVLGPYVEGYLAYETATPSDPTVGPCLGSYAPTRVGAYAPTAGHT